MRELVLAAALLVIGGCNWAQAEYRFELSEVQGAKPKKPSLSFTDKRIAVSWAVNWQDISFTLQNQTDKTIRIPWDEAAFVGFDGTSRRVIHSGVKLIARDQPQAPSVVVRRGSMTDMITPADGIVWRSGSGQSVGGWEREPILPLRYSFSDRPTAEAYKPTALGRTFQVLLPIEVDGTRSDYLFTFVVADMDIRGGD